MRAFLRLSLYASTALAVLSVRPIAAPAFAQLIPAEQQEHARPSSPLAVVVLIAEASHSFELSDVIAELLQRQSVQPRFETALRFEPDEWLDRSPTDQRSFAFVSVRERHRAQLYFRGPRGERFLLRELELRDGLDEVGRELIAQVVETSVVALLHSSEGLSREEARAGLAKSDQAPAAAPAAEPVKPASAPPAVTTARRWRPLFGMRVLGHWTGSDLGARAAFGLEGGVALHEPGWPRLRARVSLEAALPQTLEDSGVQARVITLPMRVGIDLGTEHDFYAGLSTGFDVVHLDPESVGDNDLRLLDNSTELVASSRAELRYELHFGPKLWLAFSALCDVPWTTTRYDVLQAGTLQHLATPWRIQPGAALTIGLSP